jgi:hypothetical protein
VRQVAAGKELAGDTGGSRGGRGSEGLSPIRKLAARSTGPGQHRNRSVIIRGAGLRQSLTWRYSGRIASE